MKISKAGLFGSGVLVAVGLALAPATALAYNGNNHGHHYGQLKHRAQPPPQPGSGLSAAVQTAAAGASGPVAKANQSLQAPVPEKALPGAPPVRLASARSRDDLGWLILLVLPLLVAIWLLVFARGAIAFARRGEQPATA